MTAPLFVTVAEAARALGQSTRRVRRMLAAAKLIGHQSDRDLVDSESVVRAISPSRGATRFTAVWSNRKLSPVATERMAGRRRPRTRPLGPFVATIDADMSATPGQARARLVRLRHGLGEFDASRGDNNVEKRQRGVPG